jgi:dUTP pyrophosphatase
MQIKIKKLRQEAILPNYAHPGDVGMDLYALEDYTLALGERKVFDLGFALEFEPGFAAIVKDKGGVPLHGGAHTMGGVFDAGYRGEYNVMLVNLGQEPYEVKKGKKIAQLIIYPVAIADIIETDELSDSNRGEGRFGSTGS